VKVHSLTLLFPIRLLVLARNLASLCLGREPKARVATIHIEVSFFSMSFTLKCGFLGGNVVVSKFPCPL